MHDGKKMYKNLSPHTIVNSDEQAHMANLKDFMRRRNIRNVSLKPLIKEKATIKEIREAIVYTAKLERSRK